MAYIVTFALTFLLVYLVSRRTAALPERALVTRSRGGIAIRRRQLRQYLVFLLAIMPVILLSAFREGVGTDYYYTYTPRFLDILKGERTYYEIGFYLFNRLIGLFTSEPQWIFITTSVIFGVCVFTAFYRYVEDLPFCVAFFFVSGEYFISLNNLRQALASAILLLGYAFLRKKQWIRFGLLTLLCATLHQGMLVFAAALLVIIAAEYIPLGRLLIAMAITAATAILLIKGSPALLASILPERLAYYVKYNIFVTPTIGLLRTAFNVALFCLLLFCRYVGGGKRLDIFVILQFLAVVVCCFDGVIPATYRILRLFSFWQLLGMPMAAETFAKRLYARRWVKGLLLAAFGVLCFYSIVILGDESVLPYRSIFG